MTPRIGTSEPTMSDFYCGAGGSSTGAVAAGVRVASNHSSSLGVILRLPICPRSLAGRMGRSRQPG